MKIGKYYYLPNVNQIFRYDGLDIISSCFNISAHRFMTDIMPGENVFGKYDFWYVDFETFDLIVKNRWYVEIKVD